MASKQEKDESLSYILQFSRLHDAAIMQRPTFRDSVVTRFKSGGLYVGPDNWSRINFTL